MITTSRLLLRPPEIADFEDLSDLWANADAVRYISGKPSSREESWARLLRYIGHWSAFGHGYFVVKHTMTAAYLGELGFADFKREMTPALDDCMEAGWILHPAHWGQGYASEALLAAINWYTAKPVARPLACVISPENTGSVRLAERLGFVRDVETVYKERATIVFRRPSGTAAMENPTILP